MKINSLKVAKFLSFGPQQELNDFKNFNLFIGKNGSGKTNTIKVFVVSTTLRQAVRVF
jgi:predicted ATPase